MSRSNPEFTLTNPATRFFKWHGDTGAISYYDRERQENIPVKMPFRFLVLDDVVQVGGGTKKHNEYVGYYSNAIPSKDIKTRPLVVKTTVNKFTTVEAEGVWDHIKAILPGAKYVKGLYIAYHNDDKELSIGYLKLQGAANSAWIEFNNTNGRRNICEGVYTIKSRSEEKQNGNTTYYEPVFQWSDNVSADTEAVAVDLDRQLQEYLVPYFAKQLEPEVEYSGDNGNGHYEQPAATEPVDEIADEERAAIEDDGSDLPF